MSSPIGTIHILALDFNPEKKINWPALDFNPEKKDQIASSGFKSQETR
jgi:hypothetical protein